jgi:hypothetical protein
VADNPGWTILGDNPAAAALRTAAAFVDPPEPITLATEPGPVPDDAFAIGPAILSSSVERVAPYYSAFESVDEVKRALDSGEAGRVYGCFASFRVSRGVSGDDLSYSALLPVTAVVLDLLPQPVSRVHARRASLLSADDAWFVTLRFGDDTIATIEALAVLEPAAGLSRDLLLEITASDRVLRAEPMRQSVVVSPIGGPSVAHPWWEDLNERFLALVAKRSTDPHNNAGSRLRAVWAALQQSAQTGEPIPTH